MSEKWKETQTDMHRLVGQALHTWAVVDSVLFRIFTKLIDTTDEVAGAIFFRFHGTGTRMELVSDMINLTESAAPHRISWNGWKSKTEPILKVRDLLAHNPVTRRRALRIGPANEDGSVNIYQDEMLDISLHQTDIRRKVTPHDVERLKQHVELISDQLLELYDIARLLGAVPSE